MKKFTLWLAKRFIKDHHKVKDIKVRAAYGMMEGWISVVLNLLLFVVKLIIGLFLNSMALIADAVHTLSDTLTSAIVIISFKISAKPADEDHPYGHGRAEYIATLIISILLIVTGIEFLKSGVERLLNPEEFILSWPMIGVIFITVLIKEGMGQISKYLGEEIDSKALEADFWHHRTDAISSLFVIIAMIATPLGYPWVDGLVALGVAFLLIYTGYDLAKEAADSLLGSPADKEYILQIRNTAKQVPNVLDAHDIVVHSYGQTRFIGMHVEIDIDIPPMEAHDITENVEHFIKKELGAHCTV
ncbi:MAG: cation transporter, partial [Candidatus Marinimicrobia bacterium]|nr:cation transporter [Candidatus Neomarinimicrobiota bacterium]